MQEGSDSREGKTGLISSLWRTNSKRLEPQSDENRDGNNSFVGKPQAEANNGISQKG